MNAKTTFEIPQQADPRFPANVWKTGEGWDAARSGYKVQIGNNETTIAYAWVPSGFRDDAQVVAEAIEIANRMIEGWQHRNGHYAEYNARQATGVRA